MLGKIWSEILLWREQCRPSGGGIGQREKPGPARGGGARQLDPGCATVRMSDTGSSDLATTS